MTKGTRLRGVDGRPTEYAIQRAIVDLLAKTGYIVLTTTVRRGRVGENKRWMGYGSSLGIPDLLVSRATWPHGVWLGIEVKRDAKAKLTEAQKTLAEANRIYVVSSVAEVIELMRHKRAQLEREVTSG